MFVRAPGILYTRSETDFVCIGMETEWQRLRAGLEELLRRTAMGEHAYWTSDEVAGGSYEIGYGDCVRHEYSPLVQMASPGAESVMALCSAHPKRRITTWLSLATETSRRLQRRSCPFRSRHSGRAEMRRCGGRCALVEARKAGGLQRLLCLPLQAA